MSGALREPDTPYPIPGSRTYTSPVADTPGVTIPDKPAFKAAEVCELAQIQPYVLRSWESEFPDLGLSKTPGGPRIYRRADVERVLRIRDLVFVEGLTLSGVRRRFESEQPQPQEDLFSLVAEIEAAQAKAHAQSHASAAPTVATPAAPVEAPPAKPSSPRRSAPVLQEAAAPAAAPVPAVAREQIGKLKQDMRSLLEMLGGPARDESAASAAANVPRRRTKRA